MERSKTGEHRITDYQGEQVRAFVPLPLPPVPPLSRSDRLNDLAESASVSLGRLDAMSRILPDKHIFLYHFMRKEAELSSQIEGIQSTLADLFKHEIGEGSDFADVQDIVNYVMALEYGLRRLKEDGFPLSNRLLREIHKILMSEGRGSDKLPGEFRRSQNWIGGSRPGSARYVPPPPLEVEACMADLERFLHADMPGISPLIKAGLAHVQFETIHPFLDGNGRTGRLLITFLLCQQGMLSEPLLYLSLYLKERREHYFELLNQVRELGDWEAWLEFFLEGVQLTADQAFHTANQILDLLGADEEKINARGQRIKSCLSVFAAFKTMPVLSVKEAAKRTDSSFSVTASALAALGELGIVREITGKKRNRLYLYQAYYDLLSE